jgi:hypothetical protein
MRRIYIVTACILLGAVAAQAAQTGKVIVGVNTVGVERMNEQLQDAFVEQLRENGVKVVRLGKVHPFHHPRLRTRHLAPWLLYFPGSAAKK